MRLWRLADQRGMPPPPCEIQGVSIAQTLFPIHLPLLAEHSFDRATQRACGQVEQFLNARPMLNVTSIGLASACAWDHFLATATATLCLLMVSVGSVFTKRPGWRGFPVFAEMLTTDGRPDGVRAAVQLSG